MAHDARYTLVPAADLDSPGIIKAPFCRRSTRLASKMAKELEITAGIRLLENTYFQMAMAALILCNAAVIGLETDFEDLGCWNRVEAIFLGLFTIELLMKLIILGPGIYFNVESGDFVWNVFDVIIVSLGLFDTLVSMMGMSSSQKSFATIFRMIRLLRILRIFKLIRFLRQLYMLAVGFGLAAVAVFWVTFLMTFALYICSIILVRTLGHIDTSHEHSEFLHSKFGSIPQSMITLFNIMLAPSLDPYLEIIFEFPMFMVFLLGFTVFGSLGLVAVLTGVIMESMFQKSDLKKVEAREEMDRRRKELVTRCTLLFDTLEQDDNGHVTPDEVSEIVPDIGNLFKEMGVIYAQDELDRMAEVMDADKSYSISSEEFHHFIQQMADGVRPMLILEVYYTVKCTADNIEKIRQETMDKIDEIFDESAAERRLLIETLQALREEIREATADRDATTKRSCPDVLASVSSIESSMLESMAGLRKSFDKSVAVNGGGAAREAHEHAQIGLLERIVAEVREANAATRNDFQKLFDRLEEVNVDIKSSVGSTNSQQQQKRNDVAVVSDQLRLKSTSQAVGMFGFDASRLNKTASTLTGWSPASTATSGCSEEVTAAASSQGASSQRISRSPSRAAPVFQEHHHNVE